MSSDRPPAHRPDGAAADAEPGLARLRDWIAVAQTSRRVSLWERDATGAGTWDPYIFQLYGLPVADQAPHFDVAAQQLHPADRDRAVAAFRASVAQPGLHDARFRIRRADGGVAHVHSIWQVPAGGGRIAGVLIDDTATVLAARDHEATRAQLDLLSNLVGMSVWRTDLATQRITRGEQLWRITGVEPGPQGIPVAEFRQLIHPDDLAAVDAASRQALAGTSPATAETRYRRTDGSYRTMLTRRIAQRGDDGQPIAMLGVGVDITEQVQARENYRRLLERFELVVEAAGIGLWTVDLETGAQDWNTEMRRIHGLPPGAPIPTTEIEGVADLVLEADRAQLRDCLRRASGPERPQVESTWRIRRPDGAVRTLVGRARRLEGTQPQLAGVAIDVTELQAATQALRDKETAERADRAKSAFLSRISHELRTPLNAVIGFTSLLLDAPPGALTRVQREQLGHVQQAGTHLLGLVDDLLTVGRAGALPAGADGQTCDLSDVIEQVLLWQAGDARDARVQLSVSGACPCVRGGDQQWRQVVSNLVSNAIKYNRPGGFVQLALRETADPAWAELEVRDSGRGMTPEQRRHLFEPFNRLGAERYGIPGTGLGLSITRQLVQALGGELTLDSQPGGGTRVCVRVPRIARPDEAAQAGGPAVAARQAPPADVVYVEDNEVNVLLVREILRQRPQLRLHVAGTVAQAVPLVRQVRPALLLVDLHLPDGDGYALLQALGEDGAVPARHCIALSADVMPDEVARALASGFAAHWPKPIDVGGFLDGLDRLLGRVEAPAATAASAASA